MRLTTALNEYKRRHDGRFPEESPTTEGTFSGHGDRLVHVAPDGSLRDYTASLAGLNGVDRSALGVETAAGIDWFADLQLIRQHHYRETRLVETEFAAESFTVHQFDLTLGRAHVTHVELRGAVPADAQLVAFLTLAPEGREAGVGALLHESAGPEEGTALEVYHRREHDYVTASTGLADVRGQQPERFAEIVDDAPVTFPRGGAEPYDETRLSGDFVVAAPLEREGRGARTTLVTQLSDHDEIDRSQALADLARCARSYDSADSLRIAARERTAVAVPDDVPRQRLVRDDLRVLDLLEGPCGGRIAGPEYDPFYANSGGYGYVWFRDDATIAHRLLRAADRLELEVTPTLSRAARCHVDAQLEDGTWPHRIWATDGSLAPGWANATVEGADPPTEYQADQTATVVAFLAALLDDRGDALDHELRADASRAVDRGVAALRDGLAGNGLPRRCQNAWENAVGQFTHTAATFLGAFAAAAAAPVGEATRARAREGARTVLDGLDAVWDPDREQYAMGLVDGVLDDRADAATLVLLEAACDAADADIALPDRTVDRLAAHARSVPAALERDPDGSPVAGLVRYTGDRWRSADQRAPKCWSVTTGLGAVALARFATLLEDRRESDGDGGGTGDGSDPDDVADTVALRERAGELYRHLRADGPFATDAGYLAEQVFDDGTPDSAAPLGWSHALRLEATALLDAADALPAARESTATPPERPRWTTGEKYGLCTAADHDSSDPSRVWFTLTAGALTEARFPRIDVMNVRTLEYLVRCPATGHTVRTHAERGADDDGVTRRVEPTAEDALAYRHVVEADGADGGGADHRWRLAVDYATDPEHDALVADVEFEARDDREYELYVVADLALANTGHRDRALRVGEAGNYNLLAREPTAYTAAVEDPLLVDESGDGYSVAMALAAADRFDWATVAVAGDAQLSTLFAGEALPEPRTSVDDGNVVLAGRLGTGEAIDATVAAGFARRANTAAALGEANGALDRPFGAVREAYEESWRTAAGTAAEPPAAIAGESALATQYRTAVMSLLAVEDKTYAGASIASPSVPWGQSVSADEHRGYGYNFVWSRDLYQVFSVFLAVGFEDVARSQLEYIYEHQQDERGFIPQNTYVNGITRWGGEQMDNISFPQVMAYQLSEAGVAFADAGYGYEHVRRSADYVARNGPATAQERWEEEAGYSPSSIATEIAGLTCAAHLAVEEGETADALVWLALADDWADRVVEWTATTTGTARHDRTPYFLRITRNGDPDAGHLRTLANDGPTLDERDVIDAGFLELVRLGVLHPDDPVVRNSLAVVDETIRVDLDGDLDDGDVDGDLAPDGEGGAALGDGASAGFYRYNGDGYGEPPSGAAWGADPDGLSGKGRLWPLLTGERGEYELHRTGDVGGRSEAGEGELTPLSCLRTMQRFANSGRLIAEQVWDRQHGTEYGWRFGEGTGSATPLAWSMAQFARLALGVDAGAPVETPAVVAERFRERRLHESGDAPGLHVEARFRGDELVVSGETTGAVVAVKTPVDAAATTPEDGAFELTVGVAPSQNSVTVAAAADEDVERAATVVRQLSL